MNKSFRIEEYLNEKFNSVIKLKESVHLNDQHNLLELKVEKSFKIFMSFILDCRKFEK